MFLKSNMHSDLRKILEATIRAPSGENAQPWIFKVSEDGEDFTVRVFVNRKRDEGPYGWKSRASYVAIGTALENLKIASTATGREARIVLFPSSEDPFHVANVLIIKNETQKIDPLYTCIEERGTNRKKYKITPLSKEQMATLMSSVSSSLYAELRLTTEKLEIYNLATAGSVVEQIMLSNQNLHNYFFEHVNWTKEEDEKRKIGFFVDTLELPPPAVIGFKLMSKWARALFLNKALGMNKVVRKQNISLYTSAPAMGIIVSKMESPEDAVRAGMTLERVWLQITKEGLALQPLAGIFYLNLAVQAGDASSFSSEEQKLITDSYNEIRKTFKLDNSVSYFMFRVGYANPASARAVRFSVDEVLEA